MLWKAFQEAFDVTSRSQHSEEADLKEFFIAIPFTGWPPLLPLPFKA
jgi:hypothetical protein